MNKKRIYSFEQLSNLVGRDINLPEGSYHCEISMKGEGYAKTYTFIFSEPKDDALVSGEEQ